MLEYLVIVYGSVPESIFAPFRYFFNGMEPPFESSLESSRKLYQTPGLRGTAFDRCPRVNHLEVNNGDYPRFVRGLPAQVRRVVLEMAVQRSFDEGYVSIRICTSEAGSVRYFLRMAKIFDGLIA